MVGWLYDKVQPTRTGDDLPSDLVWRIPAGHGDEDSSLRVDNALLLLDKLGLETTSNPESS